MTQQGVKNLVFLLFDEQLLNHVIEIYEKYDYLVDDDSIKIVYFISKIYTTTEQKEIVDSIKEIQKCEASEIFPDIKMLCCKLILNAYDNKLLEYAKMLLLFNKNDLDFALKNDPVVYNSPAIKIITLNSNSQDEQTNVVNKCLAYLDNKDIFRKEVEKVKDNEYKNMLKLRHAIQTIDYEYGFKTMKKLIELFYFNNMHSKITPTNFKEHLSSYIVIIDFISAFQLLDYKFTNLIEYSKLKEMFKNTILSLTIDSFLILETSQKNVLQALTETKKYLKNICNYTEDELNEYLHPILDRIKDNGKN